MSRTMGFGEVGLAPKILPSRGVQTRSLRRFQACNFAGRRRTFRHFSLERVQKYWCTQYFAHVAISGFSGRRPFGLKAAVLAMEPEGWSTHWVETDPVELAMDGTGKPTWLQRRPRGKKPRTGPAETRAYDYQSIHAQTIITFMFREHTITRASMPKP